MKFPNLAKILCLSACFLLAAPCSFAQANEEIISSEAAHSFYNQLYKTDSRLVSGEYYQIPIMNTATGHPFFIDQSWKTGTIVIDGIIFNELPLRYDISSNELILSTIDFTNSYLQIKLKKHNIEYFTLNDKLFKPFKKDTLQTDPLFYEELVNGKISLLLLKTKTLKISSGALSDYRYQTSQKKFLSINNKLFSYKGKRSLYKLFPEFKEAIKTYSRQKKIRLRPKKMSGHIELINYCNSLLESKI
ncbi:MAG: hypothetical protein HN352_05610 [Bacteroidetes bacterium]|jgi:hypothetical protein|nr:hypothetical protein [Bacteroidota bacterium]MBT3748517.1 hypothetical protein [Bacteroidota bacterium]MBT4399670.1 hypothetical protein [Bacteroidota bacterium]MBT4409557.1 hypothetical protein [Bacteroidota bacterium]MBT7092383.1 hypothetical protein [Bacteroidota bacterium]